MKKKLINVISNSNFESRRVRQSLMDRLTSRGYVVSRNFNQNAALTISIGGDGAFLKAIHMNKFPKMPIVGINTGTLGFFQEINPDEIEEFLDDYESGNYKMEEIPLIKANIFTKNRVFSLYAVNEIVLKGKSSKIIQMDVFIDNNHLQKFAGDGMMISTPVGSTAYNFSSGGSIVHTSLNSMQMTPLAPINSKAYRSLSTSLVVPPTTIIELVPQERYKNSSIILVDGNERFFWDLIRIELSFSDYKVKRLLFKNDFYWDNLKDKFL